MYSITTYNEMIESRNKEIEWHGTITLTNGDEIEFGRSNLAQSTGDLKKLCSDTSTIGIGGVYASELNFQLLNINIDRHLLYDGIIDLYTAVKYDSEHPTWGDASPYTWNELNAYTWDGLVLPHREDFPIGRFIIKEAMRAANKISVTAYDYMVMFDKEIDGIDTTARTPHQWFSLACEKCEVPYGMTASKIFAFPNGRRLVKFSNSDKTIKTWRDIVSSAAAAIGANAYMSRRGALMVGSYNNIIRDVIDPGRRYTSDISDYQSYYTGIYLNYKEEGIREYQTNAASPVQDTGLAYDLKDNCFLQIADETERAAMLKAIIDRQAGLAFTPFKATIPFNPAFDLMDTIIFTGNQADPSKDIAPITSMVMRIGGKMDISCGGENPALQTVESKESVAIENASSSYGEDVWMTMSNGPSESKEITGSEDTVVVTRRFYSKEENTMLHIAVTAAYTLSKTALIIAKIIVDNATIYTVKQNQFLGDNKITVTSGYELQGKGSHLVVATIAISESQLDPGGGGILTALNIADNGTYAAADYGVYGFSEVTALVNELQGYQVTAHAPEIEANEAVSEWKDTASYVSSAEYGHTSTEIIVNATLAPYMFETAAVKVEE